MNRRDAFIAQHRSVNQALAMIALRHKRHSQDDTRESCEHWAALSYSGCSAIFRQIICARRGRRLRARCKGSKMLCHVCCALSYLRNIRVLVKKGACLSVDLQHSNIVTTL